MSTAWLLALLFDVVCAGYARLRSYAVGCRRDAVPRSAARARLADAIAADFTTLARELILAWSPERFDLSGT